MRIFVCENSIDGIFSGIYRAYESRLGHSNIQLSTRDLADNYDLFSTYEDVAVDYERSRKVARTLQQRLGQEVYYHLCLAISAWESPREQAKNMSKAEAVYKTVVLGLSMKNGSAVLNGLGNPYVARVFQLYRSTYREVDHFQGFLRFSELENGVLFSRIHPKNDLLPLLADHFSHRLPTENFIIYDGNRRIAAVHQMKKGYILADVPDINEAVLGPFSEKETEYQQLWIAFFHSLAIESRKNLKLQSNHIPKRFWKDTVELCGKDR